MSPGSNHLAGNEEPPTLIGRTGGNVWKSRQQAAVGIVTLGQSDIREKPGTLKFASAGSSRNARQAPLKAGFRFSTKAVTPSFKSMPRAQREKACSSSSIWVSIIVAKDWLISRLASA